MYLSSLVCGHFHQLLGCAELLLRCCPWGWSVFLGHPFTSPSLWCSFKQPPPLAIAAAGWGTDSWAGWGYTSKGIAPSSSLEHLQRLSGFMARSLGEIPNSPYWANVACAYNQYYIHRQVTHLTNPLPAGILWSEKFQWAPGGISIERWVSPAGISRKIDGSFAFIATGLSWRCLWVYY